MLPPSQYPFHMVSGTATGHPGPDDPDCGDAVNAVAAAAGFGIAQPEAGSAAAGAGARVAAVAAAARQPLPAAALVAALPASQALAAEVGPRFLSALDWLLRADLVAQRTMPTPHSSVLMASLAYGMMVPFYRATGSKHWDHAVRGFQGIVKQVSGERPMAPLMLCCTGSSAAAAAGLYATLRKTMAEVAIMSARWVRRRPAAILAAPTCMYGMLKGCTSGDGQHQQCSSGSSSSGRWSGQQLECFGLLALISI